MDIQQDVVEAVVDSVSPEDVLDDLLGELKVRNYRISRINSIDNIFKREESSSFSFSFKFYKIVEFCNLNSCSELISADLLSGVFMPVRFLIFQKQEESSVHLVVDDHRAFDLTEGVFQLPNQRREPAIESGEQQRLVARAFAIERLDLG